VQIVVPLTTSKLVQTTTVCPPPPVQSKSGRTSKNRSPRQSSWYTKAQKEHKQHLGAVRDFLSERHRANRIQAEKNALQANTRELESRVNSLTLDVELYKRSVSRLETSVWAANRTAKVAQAETTKVTTELKGMKRRYAKQKNLRKTLYQALKRKNGTIKDLTQQVKLLEMDVLHLQREYDALDLKYGESNAEVDDAVHLVSKLKQMVCRLTIASNDESEERDDGYQTLPVHWAEDLELNSSEGYDVLPGQEVVEGLPDFPLGSVSWNEPAFWDQQDETFDEWFENLSAAGEESEGDLAALETHTNDQEAPDCKRMKTEDLDDPIQTFNSWLERLPTARSVSSVVLEFDDETDENAAAPSLSKSLDDEFPAQALDGDNNSDEEEKDGGEDVTPFPYFDEIYI